VPLGPSPPAPPESLDPSKSTPSWRLPRFVSPPPSNVSWRTAIGKHLHLNLTLCRARGQFLPQKESSRESCRHARALTGIGSARRCSTDTMLAVRFDARDLVEYSVDRGATHCASCLAPLPASASLPARSSLASASTQWRTLQICLEHQMDASLRCQRR